MGRNKKSKKYAINSVNECFVTFYFPVIVCSCQCGCGVCFVLFYFRWRKEANFQHDKGRVEKLLEESGSIAPSSTPLAPPLITSFVYYFNCVVTRCECKCSQQLNQSKSRFDSQIKLQNTIFVPSRNCSVQETSSFVLL